MATTSPSGPSDPSSSGPTVLDQLDAHTDRLLETIAALSTTDLAGASRCDGWTRGHVVTHLARNAEAIGNLATWALTGERREMYAGGQEGRDAAIEEGAGRAPEQQLVDVRDTALAVRPLLDRLGTEDLPTPEVERRPGQALSAYLLPFMRLREVVLHHADLDAGFGFEDVEPPLVDALLDDALTRFAGTDLAATLDTGTRVLTVGDGGPVVTGTPGALLAWLSRQDESGVRSTDPIPPVPQGN